MDRTSPVACDGVPCEVLAQRSGATQLVAVDRCSSTMDLAHELAADGAPHATVVVAEVQDAGRGRSGKSWASEGGAGVWASVLLREPIDAPPGILSLRVGMALADGLEALAPVEIGLKWPNDLFIGAGKVAGVLAEARWRGSHPEWIVVGVGVNVSMPAWAGGATAAALGGTVPRAAVLVALTQAVLSAAARRGELDAREMSAFAARDIAMGRRICAPLDGTVCGITSGGALRVRGADGSEHDAVAGSLVFHEPAED